MNPEFENEEVFIFGDSTCVHLYPYGNGVVYYILGDTLLIDKRPDDRNRKTQSGLEFYIYKILSLTSDSMTLLPITEQTRELHERESTDASVIRLAKVKPKNSLELLEIRYFSSYCYGSCPGMYLEANREGEILFHGRAHTDTTGLFRGRISAAQFAYLESKVRAVDLKTLRPEYESTWSDLQTSGVQFVTRDSVFSTQVYGAFEAPIEFQLLLHALSQVYKEAELVADSSVVNDYTPPGRGFGAKPPPPPPN